MSDRHENALDALGFEWDEPKRKSNIEKHGIDFVDAIAIFAEAHVDVASKHSSEPRREATGKLGDRFITVVYTIRGDVIRVISARIARRHDRERYPALYARGDP